MTEKDYTEMHNQGTTLINKENDSLGMMEIELTPNWDATLNYDLLEDQSEGKALKEMEAIFVGRENLLGSIVNAISQSDRRGTFLISGFRGAGKTSLVIASARRAKEILENNNFKLLPLVLNVSEVSASMETDPKQEEQTLSIDARKMLVALLRALKNKIASLHARPDDKKYVRLCSNITKAYLKATATQYKQKELQQLEENRSQIYESKHGFSVADLFKLVTAITAIAAVALESSLLFEKTNSVFHVIAAALAGTAIYSYSRSVTITKKEQETRTSETEVVQDNSLHQIENDLKDILNSLSEQKFRTIIIIEELDKIDDTEGHQLDKVIKYFKNLFTQAPALFFFITDKQYYDFIENQIENARRKLSYAVEHTFFTHRIFVDRPNAADCLKYITAIVTNEDIKNKIEGIHNTEIRRVRKFSEMDLLERFVRVLFFRAQDHFFDLKNELRRFVIIRNKKPILSISKENFSGTEQGLAVFQFLMELKTRLYAFGSGRDYANEMLRTRLYCVFQELYSSRVQTVKDFFPDCLKSGDKIDLLEEKQITNAITTLIEDLSSGGAIQYVEGSDKSQFIWQPHAQVVFDPVARLEDYELSLINYMEDTSRLIGRMSNLSGIPTVASAKEVLASELSRRNKEIKESVFALPIDEINNIKRNFETKFMNLNLIAYKAHLDRLTGKFGFSFSQFVEAANWGNLFGLSSLGNLQVFSLTGNVLLAYGSGQSMTDDLRKYLKSVPSAGRICLINVYQELPKEAGMRVTDLQKTDLHSLLAENYSQNQYYVKSIPLDEGWEAAEFEEKWGSLVADELALGLIMTNPPLKTEAGMTSSVAYGVEGPFSFFNTSADEEEFEKMEEGIQKWLSTTGQLLICSGAPYGGSFMNAMETTYWNRFNNKGQVSVFLKYTSDFFTDQNIKRLFSKGRVLLGIDGDFTWPPDLPVTGEARILFEKSIMNYSFRLDERLEEFEFCILQVKTAPIDIYTIERILRGRYPDLAEKYYRRAAPIDYYAKEQLGILLHDRNPAEAKNWYIELLESEDSLTLMKLVKHFYTTDPVMVEDLLRKMSAKGNYDAKAELGKFLFETSPSKAEVYAEELFGDKDSHTLIQIADARYSKDKLTGEKLYRKALELNDPLAMVKLGDIKMKDKSKSEACDMYKNAALDNYLPGMVKYADALREDDPEEAEKWFQKAAENNDIYSIVQLGELLIRKENYETAEIWLKRAAEQKDLEAIRTLGRLNEMTGKFDEAERWYREAAENKKDVSSVVALGDLFLKYDKPQDAESWYRLATEKYGNTDAMVRLGDLSGTRKHMEEAEKWYRKAAKENNIQAIEKLGNLLKRKKKLKESREWLNKASELKKSMKRM